MYKFENLNTALIGMSKELIKNGKKRKTRGFNCVEIPHPVLICIENPSDRYVRIPERKWNKYLPFAESLWLLLGLNDLDVLPGRYVKNLYNFSDNGRTWRAGYGARIRAFTGLTGDYDVSNPKYRNAYFGSGGVTDQLKFVIETLKKDINSRQALITIHDPVKDNFDKTGVASFAISGSNVSDYFPAYTKLSSDETEVQFYESCDNEYYSELDFGNRFCGEDVEIYKKSIICRRCYDVKKFNVDIRCVAYECGYTVHLEEWEIDDMLCEVLYGMFEER